MKKYYGLFLRFFCILTYIFAFSAAYAANLANPNSNPNSSPLGYWKTIDDVTGKPKSILHLYISGRTLSGQVVKIFPRPGYDQNEVCKACTGAKHNQRIVGMVIMQGLKQEANNPKVWSGGEILDPLNGKTYRCMVTVVKNGQALDARGYIGFSLFGRSQTWWRVGSPN
jgi:uncharacterized protein (DUF2147 family)